MPHLSPRICSRLSPQLSLPLILWYGYLLYLSPGSACRRDSLGVTLTGFQGLWDLSIFLLSRLSVLVLLAFFAALV